MAQTKPTAEIFPNNFDLGIAEKAANIKTTKGRDETKTSECNMGPRIIVRNLVGSAIPE